MIAFKIYFTKFNSTSTQHAAINYSCICSHKSPIPNNGSLFGFYNMFESDADNFNRITQEQIKFIDASNLPFKSISYTYFGPRANTYLVPSHKPYWTRSEKSNLTGNEGVTLQTLYEHCLDHQNDQVIYFHSKGTYHNNHENDILRQNLMKALSACYSTKALHTNDICGLRMSPLPYSQYSGNMWLASCQYIVKLIPPSKFEAAMNAVSIPSCPDWISGQNRYAYEHWVVSHPSVTASDVLPSSEPYAWAYKNLPNPVAWIPHLSTFPRPDLSLQLPHAEVVHCSFRSRRTKQYEFLYGRQVNLPCASLGCHHLTVQMMAKF